MASIPVIGDVTANDFVSEFSDCEGDMSNAIITIVTPTTLGTPIVNGQIITYTAGLGNYGEDRLEYEITCGCASARA